MFHLNQNHLHNKQNSTKPLSSCCHFQPLCSGHIFGQFDGTESLGHLGRSGSKVVAQRHESALTHWSLAWRSKGWCLEQWWSRQHRQREGNPLQLRDFFTPKVKWSFCWPTRNQNIMNVICANRYYMVLLWMIRWSHFRKDVAFLMLGLVPKESPCKAMSAHPIFIDYTTRYPVWD